jgi:phosphoglycolate phosphatase
MNLLFDLDGTLTDPFPGITNCIRHALFALGRQAPEPEALRWCIGPPLKKSFLSLLGTDDDELAEKGLAKYRERFTSTGMFENAVYPSIHHALAELREAGHTLYVATSKPVVYADRIIDHFGLRSYFDNVYGSELNGVRSDKGELIAYIMAREACRASATAMIGDREHDMIGAKKNGIEGIGALWGYGSIEELRDAGAVHFVESPLRIKEVCRK